MDRQALIAELNSIIGAYLKEKGLDLVELIYRYQGRDIILRILVDRPGGGISLDECAGLNNDLSQILDETNIIPQHYILEVSSPGIDRPLKTKNDFLRSKDRKVRLFLKEKINGKLEWEGKINKVVDDTVYVDIDGYTIEIPLAKINLAKQILDNI